MDHLLRAWSFIFEGDLNVGNVSANQGAEGYTLKTLPQVEMWLDFDLFLKAIEEEKGSPHRFSQRLRLATIYLHEVRHAMDSAMWHRFASTNRQERDAYNASIDILEALKAQIQLGNCCLSKNQSPMTAQDIEDLILDEEKESYPYQK